MNVKHEKQNKRRLNPSEGELFQRIVSFTISVADKYKDEKAYEAALVGLYVGLKSYTDKQHTFNLETYLHWFIKTSIEYELGYKNKDTELWRKKKQGEIDSDSTFSTRHETRV